MDGFVASLLALTTAPSLRHCEPKAKQSMLQDAAAWIASSLTLLAMTIVPCQARES